METNAPSEELPALYRAILDRVAEMEASGERAEAARLRSDATDAYSRAWDERARRRLEHLLRHASRSSGDDRRQGRQSGGFGRPASPRRIAAPER